MHVVSQNLQNSPKMKRKREQHLGDDSQYLHSLTMNTIPKIKSGIFGYVGVQTVLDTGSDICIIDYNLIPNGTVLVPWTGLRVKGRMWHSKNTGKDVYCHHCWQQKVSLFFCCCQRLSFQGVVGF